MCYTICFAPYHVLWERCYHNLILLTWLISQSCSSYNKGNPYIYNPDAYSQVYNDVVLSCALMDNLGLFCYEDHDCMHYVSCSRGHSPSPSPRPPQRSAIFSFTATMPKKGLGLYTWSYIFTCAFYYHSSDDNAIKQRRGQFHHIGFRFYVLDLFQVGQRLQIHFRPLLQTQVGRPLQTQKQGKGWVNDYIAWVLIPWQFNPH